MPIGINGLRGAVTERALPGSVKALGAGAGASNPRALNRIGTGWRGTLPVNPGVTPPYLWFSCQAMRRLSAIALCLLSACASAPSADVTKSSASEGGAFSNPTAQLSFAAQPQATSAARANTEIVRDFLDLSFRMESGRALPSLSRFEGPITVAMRGDAPANASAELSRLLTRMRNEAGLDVRQVGGDKAASITIEFLPRAQMRRVVPTAACFVVPNVNSLGEYKAARGTAAVDWGQLTQRTHASIFIPSDTSAQEVRDCLHEELAQAIGPLNDLYHLPDSVFNDDNFHTVLTSFDMLILRAYYAPELRSGMNEAEAARYLPGLMARLNPAGEGRVGKLKSVAPRAWVAAVEQSFGMRGGSAKSAAEKMLSIAMAQGWSDGRLAFSYYALGRAQITTDPEAAVRAFSQAAQIYRALPGAQIHSAHVDMQLAAIALSTGQAEQAIQFADRALPMVKQAENAALLATLMLIKAEAYENMGQAAQAKALRLDSLGWARYGFGSEAQVRARMSEVSALGSRGRRKG